MNIQQVQKFVAKLWSDQDLAVRLSGQVQLAGCKYACTYIGPSFEKRSSKWENTQNDV